MPDDVEEHLAVLKATYDYDATEPDECSVKENQILLLIQRVDDDWWKIKVKGDSPDDDDTPSGMVPAAYVEPADRTSVVKALYDYEASAPGELSIKEDEILDVFAAEGDWLLAQTSRNGGKAGYIPANYVEAASEDAESEPTPAPPPPAPAPAIVVPDSPPRPAYVDPEERVASTKSTAKADAIKTWSVSEVDSKNKKKKGTLGVGNGAVFFASESDKTPVKKWPTSLITHISTEKSKHIHLDIAGDEPVSLHFHAGSKDTADEIIDKLETSRAIATEASTAAGEEEDGEEEEAPKPATRAVPPSINLGPSTVGNRKPSVHFSPLSPQIIPPPEDSDDDDEGGHANGAGGDIASALYDFEADGEDELSVAAGEQLTVIEKDSDEWWKCRNAKGAEGVVPASYLELATGTAALAGSAVADDDDDNELSDADRKKQEVEKAEKERLHLQKEKELEERERELKRKEEAQKRAELAAQKAEEERRKRHEARDAHKKSQSTERAPRPSSAAARPSAERERPPPDQTRIWHDRTGQFRVEAAFLGFNGGKFRLHKVNGVIVEVPSEKMSPEDVRYVEKLSRNNSRKSRPPPGPSDDDDVPLAMTSPKRPTSTQQPQQPKKPRVDWFEFFLAAGCDIDDCTRYAASFERDKIDEAILPDITESTMRSLGLREGDIIRVKKLIDQRKPKQEQPNAALEEQMRKDEEMARRLQEEEQGRKPAPNLFSGPGGALKNPSKPPRRGRPEPSKSLPPTFVGADGIVAASQSIRTASPVTSTSPVQAPPRTSSAGASTTVAAPPPSGFDDDAWTVRPSSTAADRTPSAPPTSTPATAPPAAPAPPPAPAPPAAVAAPAPAAPTNLANKTESDIFDQLSRLSELRKTQSPAAATPPPMAASPPVSASPAGYAQGLGMGPSPSPIGQLQPQNTAMPYNGPRGPFAPVLANQGLLQPLIPTQTGFNSFVPTARPTSAMQGSPFAGGVPASQYMQSQPTGFPAMSQLQSQPTGFPSMQSQPTGFMQSQATGFPGMQSQPTGFPQQQQPMMSQPTGMMGGMGGFGGGVQTNPTGFNTGMGMGSFNGGMSSPPPLPQQQPTNNTSPANIFAQMKSGTFANDSAAQDANKYDALRPQQPLMAQPTGWGGGGFQGGYMGYQQ
ncbi:hypothetical protein BD626DRAFT_626074 [Schizophyllum amplum]|uniref:Actin cytoskeleton-regulatory complex protein SLA1 n=1 Tax=Schizophyllum amplum TaxID=97359 RepID=A0A550CS82_9AGAR|nr:hypothetical protein BD626DRAFT_626074 [Auriculariopsis ampla]